MQRWIVDRLAQQAGGLDAAGIAELRSVQRSAHTKLAHIAARGARLELGAPRRRAWLVDTSGGLPGQGVLERIDQSYAVTAELPELAR